MVRIAGTRKVVAVRPAETPTVSVGTLDESAMEREPGGKIPWPDFRAMLRDDLEPSERTAGKHFALLAPTRGGKTTLVTKGIIPVYREADVPVLVIDSTADPKLTEYGDRMPRWGKFEGLHRISIDNLSGESIRKIFDALTRAYKQGDCLIYIDEIRHVCDPKYLGLGKALENLWLFGGKRGITIGGATQAPRWVPGAFYDQSQAHFLFRIRDHRSRKRIQEISGDTQTLQAILPDLPRYHFAYVSPEGDVSISKYDLPKANAVR